jgi:hypothetical protein
MAEIIKIISIGDAKPVKGVWYDYFDDIFISVIPFKRRKHIRRKSVISSDKADNGTSEWHLKWQYEIIEKSYGMNHSGKKTYEISILVDEERHIIDSLVESTFFWTQEGWFYSVFGFGFYKISVPRLLDSRREAK